jgi:hypothetical protein
VEGARLLDVEGEWHVAAGARTADFIVVRTHKKYIKDICSTLIRG